MTLYLFRTIAGPFRRLARLGSSPMDGQGMVEYALLLMLIGTVVLVVLIVLGNQVHNVFNNITCSIGTLGGSCAAPRPPD